MSYLNTSPLVWGMLHGHQQGLFDLSFAIPAECADRLADGRTDIGIVPSIELTRQKLSVIRGAGIACRGAVRSILLVSKTPFQEIETLAADASSRTSVELSRIVLSRRFGVAPEVVKKKPDLGAMLEIADACLIIGDPALLLDPGHMPYRVLDLGEEWTAMTGLPMVFAVWAAREGIEQDPGPFLESLQFGLQHVEDIVEQEYRRRSITRELAREYLTRYIAYELGEREYRGLDLFLQYAGELRNLRDRRTVEA